MGKNSTLPLVICSRDQWFKSSHSFPKFTFQGLNKVILHTTLQLHYGANLSITSLLLVITALLYFKIKGIESDTAMQ